MPRVKVHVIRVEFDSRDGVPSDVREEISTELRSRVFRRDAETAYWYDLDNEIAEAPVSEAFRNRGYFRVAAAVKLTSLKSEGEDVSVVASISVTPSPRVYHRLLQPFRRTLVCLGKPQKALDKT